MADELEARVAERPAAVAVAIAELPHVEAEPANLARVIATGPTDIDLSQFGHQQRSGAMTTYEITSGSAGLAIELTDAWPEPPTARMPSLNGEQPGRTTSRRDDGRRTWAILRRR